MPAPGCFDYSGLVIQFDIRYCDTSCFVLLSQNCCCYLRSFMVLYEFLQCLFYICEICHGYSNRDCIESINCFGKIAGYRVNTQKSKAFLYTNNETAETQIRKKILLVFESCFAPSHRQQSIKCRNRRKWYWPPFKNITLYLYYITFGNLHVQPRFYDYILQGCQTHFHQGPHQPRGCLQRAECNFKTL